MTAPDYLSWENFRSTVFVPGEQRVHKVIDKPLIEVFGDGVANRIGLLIETPSGTILPTEFSRLACVTMRGVTQSGRSLIEITTSATSLQRQFYHFSVAVAERVIVEKRPAVEAIALELRCFADLLEEKPLLGLERQIGLIGELLFLERLISKLGSRAVDAWIGPLAEPHDFRLALREFEVKATVSAQRIHTIHGTEQLVPSDRCSLYLISVVLGPSGAGDGFSLADKAAQISEFLKPHHEHLNQFQTALAASGFRSEDSKHYSRQFALRRPLGIVPVDEKFPAITRPKLQNVLGALAARIDALRYDVSVEGLEREDGTTEFEAGLLLTDESIR